MERVVSTPGRLMAPTATVLTVQGFLTASASGEGQVRELVGTVVAVAPGSRTIVMDAPLGKCTLRVRAEVPEKASITAGTVPKILSDIKIGDTIRMRLLPKEDKLMVHSIAMP